MGSSALSPERQIWRRGRWGEGVSQAERVAPLFVLSVLVSKADLFCHPFVMDDEGNGRGIPTAP